MTAIKQLAHKLSDVHLKEMFKGSAIAFTFKICGSLCGYVFTLLITRRLGVDAMGRFALFYTLLTLFSVLGRMGLDVALLRFVAQYSSTNRFGLIKGVYRKAIVSAILFTVFISFLLFLFSSDVATGIFHNPDLSVYVKGVSLALLPMVLLFINLECLRGLKKIKEYAFLMHIAIPLAASILLGIAYLFDKPKNAPLVAYLVSVILAFLTSQAIWLKRSRMSTTPSEDCMGWIRLFRVSIPMLLTSSLFQVLGWTDVIMLGILRTAREVGIYNVAMKIAIAVNILSMSISTIAAPKFAELYGQGDLKKLREVIRHSTKLIFWTSLPVILVLILFPSSLLGIFGKEFKTGVYALLILTSAQFINAICGSVGFILQMTGKELIFQNILIGASIINITLNRLLIPIYGINGAAFASLISVAFWNLTSVYYVRSHLDVVTLYLPRLGRRGRAGNQ